MTKIEELFQKNNNLYINILESVKEGILVLDSDFHYIYWNRSMEVISGTKREVLLGVKKIPWEIFPRLKKQGIDVVMKRAMKGETVKIHDVPYRLKNGKSGFTCESYIPLKNEEGFIVGVVGIVQDVTDQKRSREELARIQKLESLGVLAGGIAHDFNNLLTGILGNITLAKMDSEPGSELYLSLKDAEDASNQAKVLTQQLLLFSKKDVLVKKAVNIAEVLMKNVRFATGGSNVKCIFEIKSKLPLITVDENQISRVIDNITINAVEAMPKGGVIKVSAEKIFIADGEVISLKAGEYIKVEFKDEGCGIDDDKLSIIFDPYFTTKEKGSGLGLAVCYSIIKKHDGHILVDSAKGEGTIFTFYLPVTNTGKNLEVKNGINGIGEKKLTSVVFHK